MNFYDILGIKPKANSKENNKRGLKGGAEPVEQQQHEQTNHSRDVTFQKVTPDSTIEEYEPKITRPMLSIFEYAEVHTQLALFIESKKSIKDFIDDVEVKGNVNPAELAFRLLKEGKWKAQLNRGYEVVSYSKLKINPQWENMVDNYFKQQHETQKNELFEPLGLI